MSIITKPEIVILVALKKELEPFINFVFKEEIMEFYKRDTGINDAIRIEKMIKDHIEKEKFLFFNADNNSSVSIFCCNEMGRVAAALATSLIQRCIKPKYIILAGICGGISTNKDLKLGDIVISNTIRDFAVQKWENGTIKYRELVENVNMDLINLAVNIKIDEYINRTYDNAISSFNSIAGGYVCSDVIMADKHAVDSFMEKFGQITHEIKAIEMEAGGIINVLKHHSANTSLIALKSICDFANEEKNDAYQDISAKNSAVFVKFFVQKLIQHRKDCSSDKQLDMVNIPLDYFSSRPENTGIVNIRDLYNRKSKFDGEVFLAELLQNDILLSKEYCRGKVTKTITIDRSDVSEAVISNPGKKRICKKIIEDAGIHGVLFQEEQEIQKYLIDKPSYFDHNPRISMDKKTLRWASGGVLSIIEWNGSNWIPLFFRDIKPFGWNIALGSSERRVINGQMSDYNMELNNPTEFITREFKEETFIIEGEPEMTNYSQGKFGILNFERKSIEFIQKIKELRYKYDNMSCEINNTVDIQLKHVETDMKLHIDGANHPLEDVLVCFNLMELGIEVVQVFKYSFGTSEDGNPPKYYFLDGEIIEHTDTSKEDELVRMPVALIKEDFLQYYFTELGFFNWYTPGVQPSIRLPVDNEVKLEDNVYLYKWDVERRLDILLNNAGISGEVERYQKWFDLFGDNFFKIHKNGEYFCTTENLPLVFTPATAKILNLYFNK